MLFVRGKECCVLGREMWLRKEGIAETSNCVLQIENGDVHASGINVRNEEREEVR